MTGYVYFIKPVGLPGPIKIGFSAVPLSRLDALAAWSPMKLEIIVTIPGTYALELNIQDCLARSRSHKEWFFPTDEVLSVVEAVRLGTPIEQALDLSKRHRTRRRSDESKRKSGISMLMHHRLPTGNYSHWVHGLLNKMTGEGLSEEEQARLDEFEAHLRSLPIVVEGSGRRPRARTAGPAR